MYAFFKTLLDPYTFLVTLLGAVLLYGWFRRRVRQRWMLAALMGWSGLFLLSLSPVAYLLLGSLEWRDLGPTTAATAPDALVVLGGGVAPPGGARTEALLSASSMRRCWHARQVHRQYPQAPVLVCGGKADTVPGPSEAEALGEFLVALGVPRERIVLEERSRTTYENAVEAAIRLEEMGATAPALITEKLHLVRAVRCFTRQGIAVVPEGCAPLAASLRLNWYEYILPSGEALTNSRAALHEWIGLLWYWCTGKI